MKIPLISIIVFAFASIFVSAEVKINITCDRENQTYIIEEIPYYYVTVTDSSGAPALGAIHYKLSPETQPVVKEGTIGLINGKIQIKGITSHVPGFITIFVQYIDNKGKLYNESTSRLNVAFSPEQIKPTVKCPNDFDEFWRRAIQESINIPLKPKLQLIRQTDSLKIYHLCINNYRHGAHIYGILCIPIFGKGKYPVLLKLPGSGIKPYFGDTIMAKKGLITLEIGIHGIPVNLPEGIYRDLASGGLYNYNMINSDNKESYYYKNVYMGCYRAIDFLISLPEYDGKGVGVYGHSQGGALAIITAALHPKVTCLVSHFPALCDLTGYLYGRAGGWPHIFSDENRIMRTQERIYALSYYDVVNFASRVCIKGVYCVGYNDWVCPPTSFYSAINQIKSEKIIHLTPSTGHAIYPEIWATTREWLYKELSKN